jgi:predicted AAA+ superfamily ATPase
VLTKTELLNLSYPYGGIDSKINKAQKYYFMSPSIRKVVLAPLVGTETDMELYTKMLEDIVVLYLKRIFKQETIVSFTSDKSKKILI